jgi:uncharacterized membrane protein YeaQ/YmgE (transglycosylase-associated protein family)
MAGLFVALAVGAMVAWLSGKVLKATKFGLTGDLIVGALGGYIGGWLWGALRFPPPGDSWGGIIATSTVGALIVLVLLRLIKT